MPQGSSAVRPTNDLYHYLFTLQIKKTVCEVLLNALDNNDLNHVHMLDEANFHLCGNVSFQNCRYWATENPRDIHQKPLLF